MKVIENGVCAATGFKAGSIHCGIRKNQTKDDLALIVSDVICQTAAVYTKNKVKAAPILVTKEHLSNGLSQAVIVNSGNANACNPKEIENAKLEAQCAADTLNMDVENVLVASTGVIGQVLPIEKIQEKVSDIDLSVLNNLSVAKAIMTTDTKEKSLAVEFKMGNTICHMGGICKGSGMIHPNMGTMLAFITTDCKVDQKVLQACLLDNTNKTFNRVSVDGDTSTNDMCIVMANGMAQNDVFEKEVFDEALHFVMEELAKKIAADGEGAGKLMTVTVNGVDRSEERR